MDLPSTRAPHVIPLMVAAKARQLHVVRELVKRGCSKGAMDDEGKTAVDYALEGGHQDVALADKGHAPAAACSTVSVFP